MARFQKAIDIWTLNDSERARLPVGQWVYAGDRSNLGRFYGQGASTVVAWQGNCTGGPAGHWARYQRALRDYGATVSRPR